MSVKKAIFSQATDLWARIIIVYRINSVWNDSAAYVGDDG